jgi:hypothetical protein
MATADLDAREQDECERFEKIRRLVARRARIFFRQGAVVASWRQWAGRRLGPYYRLAYREQGRQRSIYLGKSESLAEKVRQLLAAVQQPRREERCLERLQANARAALRATKDQLRKHLAVWGIRLKGSEFRGVSVWRHAPRWDEISRQLGLPCARLFPLLGFG